MSDRMHPYVTGQPPDRWPQEAQERVRWPASMQARLVLYDAHGDALWGSDAVAVAPGDSVTFTVPKWPMLA